MSTDSQAPRPKVLAYYFPDWHVDSRNETWFGEGWTEWELVRSAQPRFEGHRLPRIPALGYFDEADPEVAATQIDLARSHGVDGFLVDFYWYDDGPYLARALDEGLLGAPNAQTVELGLMWANHELVDIFPLNEPNPDRIRQLKPGALSRTSFESMCRHVIEHYFSLPQYLKVNGMPWFSLYEIGGFIDGMGGLDAAREALDWFRDETIRAGHPGLHLDIVVWGFAVLPTGIAVNDPSALISDLGFDSASSYVWIHHADVTTFDFPEAKISELRKGVFAEYEEYAQSLPVPFYPNVTVGWDSSARTAQGREYTQGRYPWFPIWQSDPTEFRQGLEQAREFLARHGSQTPVVTVNAWNEWTEGSHLLPDTVYGTQFLEAILEVFGPSPIHDADVSELVQDVR